MNEKAPTRGQRLNLNLRGSDNSTSPIKHKRINYLKTLKAIAEKWHSRGYYDSLGRAFEALVGGDL